MFKEITILIILFSLVLFISGCVQQPTGPSGPVCNPPYIVKGYGCCLDQNGNNICDTDEPVEPKTYCGDGNCDFNEDCSSCPQDCGECETTEYCGDGACSSEENVCKYDTNLDRYKRGCSDDCGHNCSAKIVLSSDLSKSEETYSYNCLGYKEIVCNKTENNKFSFTHQISPYESVRRGIHTIVKNVGEKEAGMISSSFECYSENRTVLDSDEDFYKEIRVRDYFYLNLEERELISKLDPVYPTDTAEWYFHYYLYFDIKYMEKGFDLVCDITLTSEEPTWTNTQTIDISFIKD